MENKSLQTDSNLKSANQSLSSNFEACVVLEPRSSPPNCVKNDFPIGNSQPKSSQLVKLHNSMQEHSINEEVSPQSGYSIVNRQSMGRLGQEPSDVLNEPQYQTYRNDRSGFSPEKTQPLNSHREYVQQRRSSLESRPFLPRPHYNSLSNHFHVGNGNPKVSEKGNYGGAWKDPMTLANVPGQESVPLIFGKYTNRTDSQSLQSKNSFEVQIPNLPQRVNDGKIFYF